MRIDGISVVIACFNGAPWIRAAVCSVLQQAIDRPIEVVIIDDGSQDATVSVIQSLKDPRVRIFQNTHNLGTAKSRNLGVQKATYGWLAFNDQDDVWLEDKLTRQCGIIEKFSDVDGVAGGYARLGKDGRTRWSAQILHKRWSPSHSPGLDNPPYYKPARHGPCYIQSLLIKKATILSVDGFRENLPIAYDPDLFLRLGEIATLAAIDEPVFLYRLSQSSITGAADLDSKQFLGGFAFMYAAEAARTSQRAEPDLSEFLQSYQPSAAEIRRFVNDQVLRNINTRWVNDGFWRAVLAACQQTLQHPSLITSILSRFRWWSRS